MPVICFFVFSVRWLKWKALGIVTIETKQRDGMWKSVDVDKQPTKIKRTDMDNIDFSKSQFQT